MELRHLRYFVAVAEEESIARAAKRLHVSEPPLSRQIRDLEAHLGVVLIERGPRSIRLTDAGRRFLPEARAVLARAVRAVAVVQGKEKASPAPTLRVGILGPSHVSYLRKRSERLRTAWPGAKVHFDSATPTVLLAGLRAGQFDAVCLDLPLPPEAQAQVASGAWNSRTVYHTPMIAVLPSGHPLASSPRVALASLADDDFVLPAWTGQVSLGKRGLAACRQAGFEPRVTRWIEGPPSGVIAAVATGAGVSVLSAPLSAVRLAGVVYRPLEPPVPSIDYALVWDQAAAPAAGWLKSFAGS